MGGAVVFAERGGVVAVAPAAAFPRGARVVVAEAEPIAELCASEGFAVIAYATEGGRIAVVSARSGRVLASALAAGGRVQGICVTDAWGFVVAKTEQRIAVWSLSGIPIGAAECAVDMRHWSAYEEQGADVIAMLDSDRQLWIFEAFRPEGIRRVMKIRQDVVAMRASTAKGVIAFITRDGKVLVVPLPSLRDRTEADD
jgi:hypothetical protein